MVEELLPKSLYFSHRHNERHYDMTDTEIIIELRKELKFFQTMADDASLFLKVEKANVKALEEQRIELYRRVDEFERRGPQIEYVYLPAQREQ